MFYRNFVDLKSTCGFKVLQKKFEYLALLPFTYSLVTFPRLTKSGTIVHQNLASKEKNQLKISCAKFLKVIFMALFV
jgi:hypothetical protein